MDLETFQTLPTQEVAHLVQEAGVRVCVFPINGTRRWLMLEHPDLATGNFLEGYVNLVGKKLIELSQMFFDHGLDTLLLPLIAADIAERGEEYMKQMVAKGLGVLITEPGFQQFYADYDVRVSFYGEYQRYLSDPSYAHLLDLFEQVVTQTRSHQHHRILYALFAQNPDEAIAELTTRYVLQHHKAPTKQELIELYYGESIPQADMFIGFGKFRIFDMPLILTDNTALYFTVSPSPYLTAPQLREMLYDHLYVRRRSQSYSNLSPDDWEFMRKFYQDNQGKTLGVGANRRLGFWYPLPQVVLSDDAQQKE